MEVRRIDPDQAKAHLDANDGHVYLDVRTEEEFRCGRVPGSVNVPVLVRNPNGPGLVPNPDFVAQVAERFAKDTPIIAACLRGGRSLRAAGMLIARGFSNVVDMRGGYDGELDANGDVIFPGWTRRGLPTTSGAE